MKENILILEAIMKALTSEFLKQDHAYIPEFIEAKLIKEENSFYDISNHTRTNYQEEYLGFNKLETQYETEESKKINENFGNSLADTLDSDPLLWDDATNVRKKVVEKIGKGGKVDL